MKHSAEPFITAIKDGKYVSINDCEPGEGKKCGCTCPECGKEVRSNVTDPSKGNNYTNRFSHLVEEGCNGGYKETELHLFAKNLIASKGSIKVPYERKPIDLSYTEVVLEKAFPIKECKQYRPDIIVTNILGEKIAIEIIVTHTTSAEKKALYLKYDFRCLEIDLSEYKSEPLDEVKELIKSIVLEYIDDKKWLPSKMQLEKQENETFWSLVTATIIALMSLIWICSCSKPMGHKKRRK